MSDLNSVQGVDVQSIDAAHIWHPYAEPGLFAYPVDSTNGVHLQLADGRLLIDAMSSWWAAIHGHSNPRLTAAAKDQIDRMSHVMFGGLTHAPAALLTERLLDITGGKFSQVFYSDSGSVAVEVAMKMALQWHLAAGRPSTRFFTIRGGYHGDTFSPMSVTDPVSGMHAMFRGVLPEHVFVPRPPGGLNRATDDPELVTW